MRAKAVKAREIVVGQQLTALLESDAVDIYNTLLQDAKNGFTERLAEVVQLHSRVKDALARMKVEINQFRKVV